LARSVVEALMSRGEEPLPPAEPFDGAGVYAIYYYGDFKPYSPLIEAKAQLPIYVGKAVPIGARKGGRQFSPQGRELYIRLNQHAKSIEQANNLNIHDFRCRYLVVEPVWITLAERFLIEHYYPIWNIVIDGFGNHDPGAGRRGMKQPQWDILHPGRPWAAILRADESSDEVLSRLQRFFDERL
jgi:hypothetical protein